MRNLAELLFKFRRKPKRYSVPKTVVEWDLLQKIEMGEKELASLQTQVFQVKDRIRGYQVELTARQYRRMREKSSLKLRR